MLLLLWQVICLVDMFDFVNYDIGCLHPVHITQDGETRLVPCGKCASCLRKRAGVWSSRLQVEASQHKYVFFVTLTYSDLFVPQFFPEEVFTYQYFTDHQRDNIVSFLEEHEVSARYLVLRYKDIQNFFKRLRNYIYEDNCVPSYGKYLRYYCCGEYGETTKRPHYHLLLFSDCEELCTSRNGSPSLLEMYVNKAWSVPSQDNTERVSIGRIDFQLVRDNAARYVSDYVTATGSLPLLLQQRAFRPFCVASKNPPLGLYYFDKEQAQAIIVNGYSSITNEFGNDIDGNVDLSLFKSVKDSLFPKCYKYYKLSYLERFALNTIALYPYQGASFNEFVDFLSDPEKFGYSVGTIDVQWFCNIFEIYDFGKFLEMPEIYTNVYRQWRLSNHFLYHCSLFSFYPIDYLDYIESFYNKQDYKRLFDQLSFEEEFSKSYSSKYLISFIDPLFFERKLRYKGLIEFGFGFRKGDDPVKYDFRSLDLYRSRHDRLSNYIEVGKSYKAIKDYATNNQFSLSNINVL